MFFRFQKKGIVYRFIKQKFGFTPKDCSLFELAFTHKSLSKISNERLEFLGDAFYDLITANYLFALFPNENEGELTRLRSNIVNRDFLNTVGKNLMLDDHIKMKGKIISSAMIGNTLEAIMGAIFLDQGYKKGSKIILETIVKPFVKIEEIKEQQNHINLLFQWGQKHKKKIEFKVVHSSKIDKTIYFTTALYIDGKEFATQANRSKKKGKIQLAKTAYQKLIQSNLA